MRVPALACRATLLRGALLFSPLLLSAGALPAQQLSLGAGYTRMEGRLGDTQSDHGAIVRLGVDLKTWGNLVWALEGGVERLNEIRNRSTTDCIVPGGATTTCHFDRRARDTGWSVGTTLRLAAGAGVVRPYGLVGLGYLNVRERDRLVATDNNGATLDNFTYDGTYSDPALQGHLGAGFTARPASWPVALYAEGRMTRLIHNYSGGIVGNWNPTAVVGVRR